MKALLLASTLLALSLMACSVLAGASDAATDTETPRPSLPSSPPPTRRRPQ
jgi:hypothetical protein